MTHTIRLAIILVITWLLLSGMFEPLMLGFGLFSVIFSLWITSRMLKIDQERYSFFVTGSFAKFLFKLGVKVVQSNIDVCARILGFKPVESTFVTIDLPFKDDVAKVLYANAITLTPGSSSIAMGDNTLLIHTISEDGAQDLINSDVLRIMPKQYAIKTIEIDQ
ncbi:Na+/H+ antiporter subunit E [Agaribacter marinus]|uniref:Cation transporter n=1 Tax=Agaribacter marinus TaxID=1431249 RepID=A0AA37T4M7_9ALTE|nr:Na+/H+ antiporter subunit E [Agaribacter marinus]GLR71993.1 cation transporter [Agaribacter marinus]